MSTTTTTDSSRSFHQRIKKFSRFLTTKVKEKTHHVLNKDNEDQQGSHNIIQGGGGIVKRHSSYIQSSPNSINDDEFVNNDFSYDDTILVDKNTSFKQEDLYQFNTMPSPVTKTTAATTHIISLSLPTPSITAALSPPPRQLKKREFNKMNPAFTTISNKPCLSRSNALGHNDNSSVTIVKYITAAPATTNHAAGGNITTTVAPILLINHDSSSFGSSSISSSSLSSLAQPRCNMNNKT